MRAGEAEEAREAAKELEEAAAGAGVNGCASFELEGSFAGLLTLNERQIVAEALLEQMDAGTVASVYREELCTVYAWKKGAGEGVRLPEGKGESEPGCFLRRGAGAHGVPPGKSRSQGRITDRNQGGPPGIFCIILWN